MQSMNKVDEEEDDEGPWGGDALDRIKSVG